MISLLSRAAVTLLLVLAPNSAARAEARFALLVGNQRYSPEIGQLVNPHNDVALLERTLKSLEFEVIAVRDAGLAALHAAVNAHVRRVRTGGQGTLSFIYYSGHGAQDAGTGINYLIPVDVRSAEDTELWDESLRLTDVTGKLKSEASNATHFVVFDACRNGLKLKKTGTRAILQAKGFVPLRDVNGMLIAYATAEGELASDVGVGAGPYARVLAEEIIKPGVEAVTMFRRVQVRVRADIGQEPWLGFNGLGEVHFAGLTASSPSRTDVVSQPEGTGDDVALAWSIVKDSNDLRSLEAFRRQYGKGNAFFDRLAEARIEEVKKNVASLPPSVERRKEALSADTRADYVRQVQLLLKARRCYSGELNGSSRDTQVGVDLFATSSARRGLAKVAHIQLASATIAEFENWLEWARSSDPSRGDICIAETGSRPTAQKPRTDPSPKAAAPRREAPARQPGPRAPSMTGMQ